MRKITMFIASLFLTIGAMAQVVEDGVYTIKADEGGKRGFLAACSNHTARPVLTEIDWSQYATNGCPGTDIVENGKYWYVRNVNDNVYIYNIGNGKFINGDHTDNIFFGEGAYAVKAGNYGTYVQFITEKATGGNRWLSMGCGTTAPNQVKWENGTQGDGGALLTLTAVADGMTTYAAQIAAADAIISSKESEVETPVVEENKEYYLVNNDGTDPLYFNLRMSETSGNQGNGQVSVTDKMIVKFEKVEGGYHFVAMMDLGMGGATKQYLTASSSWAMGYSNDSKDALVVDFKDAGNGLFYITNTNGFFKIDNSTVAGGVYLDGKAADAAKWAIVDPESVEEPETPAAEPLTYVSHTPNTPVERITQISIVFSKDVQAVNGMIKLKNGGSVTTAFASTDVNINGSTVTYYLMNPVKVSGVYTLEFPAEAVVATDGGKNAEAITLTITVEAAAAAPTFKSSSFGPKFNYNCYSLGEINVTFSENIEIASVEPLKLMNGEVEVATITDMEVGVDGKSLCLYLDEPLTNEVKTTYSIVIPAGYVKTAGTDLVLAADKTINNIKVIAPFEVKKITPANGETVEAIENIVIEFSKPVMDYNLNNLVLKNADGEVALAGSANGNVLTLTPAVAVANGTYTLSQKGTGTNGFEVLASGEGDGVVSVEGGEIKGAPVYTITVAAPELDELELKSSARNPLTTAWEGEYKLAGVKLNFFETVDGTTVEDRVKLRDGVTEYGKIVDADGNTVAVLDKKLGANNDNYANLYTSTPVTTAGTYKVIVYSGVIVTMDGEAEYKGGEFEFTVAKHDVEITPIDPPYGDIENINWYLKYSITINYADEITVDEDKAVEMTVGEETYTAEVTPVEESWGYVIYIAFDAEAEYAYGNYTLTIPAELYTVNGVANAKEVYTFTYAEPAPTPGEGEGGEVEPVTVTVTPASGTVVEQIEAIQVLFSNEMMYENIGYLYMYDQNENMYLLASAPAHGVGVFVPINMFNDAPIVITEPGTYRLSLANYTEFGLTGNMEFSWTIEGDNNEGGEGEGGEGEGETTAIDAVDAEAENAVIYDLTGRRVEKITKAGIYVINGVKKVVK